jgi:hypothetical protein
VDRHRKTQKPALPPNTKLYAVLAGNSEESLNLTENAPELKESTLSSSIYLGNMTYQSDLNKPILDKRF